MKKIIILFSFIFVLVGCSQNAPTEIKEVKEDIQQTNQTKTMEKQRTLPDQEDLAAIYNQAIIKTNQGDIAVEFYSDDSPVTVNNFLNLAKKGFYDGTLFHRVMEDFMIQGGDPNSRNDDWSTHGIGGPDYRFGDEFNAHKLVRGALAMANAGPNTNGSQFFIVTTESTPWLDGKHTNFGYVVEGMDVVEKIEKTKVNGNDHPLEDMKIESIELVEKK